MRLQLRELRDLRLSAIDLTRRWAAAYSNYVRDSWVNEGRSWAAEPYAGARLGLIGAEQALRDFCSALDVILRCDRDHPPHLEDMVALEAAEEAVQRALSEQADRLTSGAEPILIPEAVVAEVSSQVSLARQWYSELGLVEREKHIVDQAAASTEPDADPS